MKLLRNREIFPNNSPSPSSNKTSKPRNRRKTKSPPSPSTPSQLPELKPSSSPSPMSSFSSPPSTPPPPPPAPNPNLDLGFSLDSESGSNLRRSRRLAAKHDLKEEETQGNTISPLQNVDISSKLEKSEVFGGENVDLEKKLESLSETLSETLGSNRRRSSRLALKLSPGGNEGNLNVDGLKSAEKRKGGSLIASSKKVRVFEKGGVNGKCLLPSLEDELMKADSRKGKSGEDKESLSEEKLKETLVGSEVDRSEEAIVVPDSPIDSDELGVGTSSGSFRRRSERLSANVVEGVDPLSKTTTVDAKVEGSNIDQDMINSVGDQSSSKVKLAVAIDDELEGTEVNPKANVHEQNLFTGNSRRRSERLAATDLRIDLGKAEGSNIDSIETKNDGDQSGPSRKRRYSKEEKGKVKFDLNLKPEEQPEVDMNIEVSALVYEASDLVQSPESNAAERAKQLVKRKARSNAMRRERFHDIARQSAAEFAHFRPEEEAANAAPTSDNGDGAQEIEDWPGPFSTAMKIIRDRTAKLNAPKKDSTESVTDSAPVIDWLPSRDSVRYCPKPIVPALQDLCLNILSKHSEAIASLKYVPTELKNKLTEMLCNSRKMDNRFMDLLVSEVPEVVRVRDCSWMTEEQMMKSFGQCDTSILSILQLDLCGRCMPDYVLRATLARSPNCLPSLVSLSLKGACRVTDSGLSSLVASAPFLKSINLSQCSLITHVGINAIADRLGLLLRELYLDNCQSIDAMLILPALKRLKCLEVLSVADLQTVCDDFIGQFIGECSLSMKELGLANCEKLSDAAVKVIAESFPGLCALDLTNLRQLTDFSIGYIANGCSSIQKLKLCRNSFSDEAIAAYLEASGASLTELSLNNIKKVGPHTALSLAKNCARNLLSLDLSWCRNLTDNALGYVVDSCCSLRMLKLFGCTQISNAFVGGHSNPNVRIIGLKMTPILEHLNVLDSQEGPLKYSSVTACS